MAERPVSRVEVEVSLAEGVSLPLPEAAVEKAVRATLAAEGHDDVSSFIPAYLIASLLAWRRGGHYYHDNWFERDARRACGQRDGLMPRTHPDPARDRPPARRRDAPDPPR